MPTPAFTPVLLVGQFTYADGSLPGPDSAVDFLLSSELTNSATGTRVPARTITVPLGVGGMLSVTLYATNDPLTRPVGATYTVTERIVGTDGRPIGEPRTYAITLPYDAPSGTINLGLLIPA